MDEKDSVARYAPMITHLLLEADALQELSSRGGGPHIEHRWAAFMSAWNQLPEEVRNTYFSIALRERIMRSQIPAIADVSDVPPHAGINQVNVRAIVDRGRERDNYGEIRREVARRKRVNRGEEADVGEGRKAAPLVNYGSGLRQTRRGGATTIKAMAPIMEYNDIGDDPYVMRPKVQ